MLKFEFGDCLAGLAGLEDRILDLTLTSPPFGDLRRYGGHPFTQEIFEKVANEMWRVTKPGGVVCWVEGDEVLKSAGPARTFITIW